MTPVEQTFADLWATGTSPDSHPVQHIRDQLNEWGAVPAAGLARIDHGQRVLVGGLVTHRQRPPTAGGVVFMNLEDETGMVNVVVWRNVSETQRRALLGSHLLAVHGVIERQGEVVHLIAGRLVDHSHLLGRLLTRSRDFH
jgi:error-prone DNA polymerase